MKKGIITEISLEETKDAHADEETNAVESLSKDNKLKIKEEIDLYHEDGENENDDELEGYYGSKVYIREENDLYEDDGENEEDAPHELTNNYLEIKLETANSDEEPLSESQDSNIGNTTKLTETTEREEYIKSMSKHKTGTTVKKYTESTSADEQDPLGDEQRFVCNQCPQRFNNKVRLREHQSMHSGHKPFTCDMCDKVFQFYGSMCRHKQQHFEIQIPQQQFVCDQCPRTFKTQLSLDVHRSKHTDEKPFSCDECGKQFRIYKSMIEHRERHSKNNQTRFPCDQCPRSFNKQVCLDEHRASHTGEKPFSCDECGKQFRKRMKLNEHKVRHRFKCTTCPKTFVRNSDLKIHLRFHAGKKPIICDICNKCFSSTQNLYNHKRQHVDVQDANVQKRFVCDICNLECSTKMNLHQHKRRHVEDRSYRCTACPKTFVRNYDLTVHLLVHTGEMPFSCDMCNKQFRAKRNLNNHKKEAHLGADVRKYKCKHCDKKFLRSFHLESHMTSHTGEKLFKCEVCNRGYSSKLNVKRHMEREHTVEKNPPALRARRGEKKVGDQEIPKIADATHTEQNEINSPKTPSTALDKHLSSGKTKSVATTKKKIAQNPLKNSSKVKEPVSPTSSPAITRRQSRPRSVKKERK